MINDLSDKKYILSIDLALAKSGWNIYCLNTKKIVEKGMIQTKAKDVHGIRLKHIYKTVKGIHKKYPDCHIVKESCPMQAGKFTTIKVLQSLAKAHSVVEMYYPYADNIHSTSIKWKIGGSGSTKKDRIREIVNEIYSLDIKKSELDISDSVAVLRTFLIKFNEEIDKEVKTIRKKIKTLKTDKAVKNSNVKIEELLNRKVVI